MTMNEIYKIMVNILDIVKANNLFLADMKKRIEAIEKSLTFEIPTESEPDASGAETEQIVGSI